MPLIWKPQPKEVLQSWIDAIFNEASDDLNEWEATFMNDIDVKVRLKGELSQAQEEKLEQIYTEKTK